MPKYQKDKLVRNSVICGFTMSIVISALNIKNNLQVEGGIMLSIISFVATLAASTAIYYIVISRISKKIANKKQELINKYEEE